MQVNCAQMFLHSVIAKKEDMQLRVRDLEWWMHRRQIPQDIQHRVRRYERQRWAALRGIDEETIINDMPEGLRRDVQRHLCVDLVKQVLCWIVGISDAFVAGLTVDLCNDNSQEQFETSK